MKRKLKVKFNIVLFIILLIALIAICGNSYAKDISITSNTGNITVEKVEAGVKISEYKLATVNYDYEANQPKDPEYTWVDEVQEWIDASSVYNKYSKTSDFAKESSADEIRAFYDAIAAAIKGGDINIVAVDTISLTGKNSYPVTSEKLTGVANFENLEMGTYLTLIENGYRVYTPSVVSLNPKYDSANSKWILNDEKITVKSTEPSVTKTVTDNVKIKDNYSIVDEINYNIVADIPTYLENSLGKKFTLKDKMDKSLSLDNSSIVVKGANGTQNDILTVGTDYTVSYDSENNTFVVNFIYEKIKKYSQVLVSYKAKLTQNSDLVIGENGNKDVVTLEYSNNPYDASSQQIQKSSENTVYTYGIELVKIDKNSGSPLADAEYEIKNSTGTILYFVADPSNEGIYYLSDVSTAGATKKLKTNSEGKFTIKGLDEGKYTLTETKAPNGYVKSQTSTDIEIKYDNIDGILDGLTSGIYSITEKNSAGFSLPVTGGKGTAIFIILGTVFIVVGLFVVRGFSKKEE